MIYYIEALLTTINISVCINHGNREIYRDVVRPLECLHQRKFSLLLSGSYARKVVS